MEVYSVKMSYVCTDVAVWISNWSSDDNRHVYNRQLVLVAQYLTNPSLVVDSNFVRKHDKSLVVHLLEPAIKQRLKGSYVVLESSTDEGGSCPPQTFPTHRADKVGMSP